MTHYSIWSEKPLNHLPRKKRMSSAMDPLVRAMGAISREVNKIVGSVASKEDKLLVIQMGERKLKELKESVGV